MLSGGQTGRTAGIGKVYTQEVHNNLAPLYANWDPGKRVDIGDYGTIEGASFNYIGKVASKGIQFSVLPSTGETQREFMSKSGGSFEVFAQGQARPGGVVAANAGVDIQFTSQDSVFFNAGGCTYEMVEDKDALGRAILDLVRQKKWDKHWVVLTDRVRAGATTIAMSASSSAGVTLQAAANLPTIDLASGSLKLTASRTKDVAYTIVTESNLTPLIGFCGIHTHIFTHPTFGNALRSRKVFAVEGVAGPLSASFDSIVDTLRRKGKKEKDEVLTFEPVE